MHKISTSDAAPAGGHYSQAIEHGGLVYVSGQLPVKQDGSHDPQASLEVQARQALANLLVILKDAGATPATVLKVTVYLAGVEHWPAFNAAYAEVFGNARPARSVVPVPALHYGYLVEIDAVAVAAARAQV